MHIDVFGCLQAIMQSVKELATPEGFEKDPGRVWQFYHYRREL